MSIIPVCVVVLTRNEAPNIERCLHALKDFDDVFVVDSASSDDTVALARACGAQVIDFHWNGDYPKKKQWALEHVPARHDWVLLLDADEVVTPELADDIHSLFSNGGPQDYAGFFLRGRNVAYGRILRFGLQNNKLALLNRTQMAFPVVEDLDIEGGNEVEGHYQPVLVGRGGFIGQFKAPLLHFIHDNGEAWEARHIRYAKWEAGMNRKKAWPEDPVLWRESLKRLLRIIPGRPALMFLYSYVFKAGFLDGQVGFQMACDRARYYALIRKLCLRKENGA